MKKKPEMAHFLVDHAQIGLHQMCAYCPIISFKKHDLIDCNPVVV